MPTLTGLTKEQALQKLQRFGKNEISDTKKTTPLLILFRQVKSNFVVYLLFFSAIASFVVGKDVTGYTVLMVIFLVISTGFFHEYKAEQAINALKNMITPTTTVVRDNTKLEIPSAQIVPGDLVILGTGEKVPADCVILDGSNLRVNESVLTGEPQEISKEAFSGEIGQHQDMHVLNMGTFIVNGRCIAQVLHTGMNTKFGKIATLISTAEKELPLQAKINRICLYMVIVAIAVSTLTGALLLYRAESITNDILTSTLVLVIALCISSFPEGFPVVLTSTLAVGSSRMAKKNALVNRMSIIETLGEVTVICSDKTGTITKGEMTVKLIYLEDKLYEVGGVGYSTSGSISKDGKEINISEHEDLRRLIKAGVYCNDAEVLESDQLNVKGSPTEVALLVLGAKSGLYKDNLSGTRIEEQPFNSTRKMMSVLVDEDDGTYVYAKGAPEFLITQCAYFFKNGQIHPLDSKQKDRILDITNKMAKNAFRTLGLATKKSGVRGDKNYQEDSLVFLGILGLEDPPRAEVSDAIKSAQSAGISVKMITGDNKETAQAISRQIGLSGSVIEGFIIDQATDAELEGLVLDNNIFARVKPEHKIRIVKALKARDEVVVMTGDGVNDAPALKEAHVGVAMGKNGTDVSRSASDLILKDDNFSTIVAAISEGRTIFSNIRKFVTYQLSANMAFLIVLFIGALIGPYFGWPTSILAAIQILFMNLVTDNLPAITLGLNPTSADVMQEKPRKNADILNTTVVKLIIFTGVIMAIFALGSFYVSFNIAGHSAIEAQTTALLNLIVMQIFVAFSYRSFRKNTLTRSPFVNKYLFVASVLSILATITIIYTPLQKVFETSPLDFMGWVLAFSSALSVLVILDISKQIFNRSAQFVLDTK